LQWGKSVAPSDALSVWTNRVIEIGKGVTGSAETEWLLEKLRSEALNDFLRFTIHQDETGTCVQSQPNFNMVDIFQLYIYMYKHTHTHTHIYIYIYAYTHTHT
jgi:hypothetical protein